MHDFSCKNPDDMYYENLAKKIKYFKEEEEGTQKINTLSVAEVRKLAEKLSA